MSLRLVPLREDGLEAFERILGGPEFDGCFCAVWTCGGPDWAERCQNPDRPNLEETRRRVRAGEHIGFLVYEHGNAVAWTGLGPKTGFPSLKRKLGSRLTPISSDVWSIGCIALPEHARGRSLGFRVLQAAVQRAREAGAVAVEAYPTRDPDPARRYRGTRRAYECLGFDIRGEEADDDNAILLMRLDLTEDPDP